MTVRLVRDAVKAQLETRLAGAVFTSFSVKNPPARYAVVFVSLPKKIRHRFMGGQWRHQYRVTVHSIGTDEDLALWVHERVDQLTAAQLTIPGRVLDSVEFVSSTEVDLNDKGTTPLWFVVTEFYIYSDPA